MQTRSLKKSQNHRYNFQKYLRFFFLNFDWKICILSSFSRAKFLYFFNNMLTLTLQKSNPEPLFKFLIATMLGWFLYFKTALNIGWEISIAKESVFWYSGIFKVLTAFDKNVFKISAFSPYSLTASFPSTNVIFFRRFYIIW